VPNENTYQDQTESADVTHALFAISCSHRVAMARNRSVRAQEPVQLYAAGSLRVALTDVAAEFEKQERIPVATEFGASGLLRERIEKGAPAEVFASADMGHPERLHKEGRSEPVSLFARNQLCALASPKVDVTTATLLDVLLDSKIRVGSSTPKNDPSGDYTWAMFEKAENIRSGAYAALSDKALKLVGGADAPPPPQDRSVYTMLMQENKADVFLTYCTNAILAAREAPGLKVIQLPESLAVGAEYGMTVINGASAAAKRLSQFILSARAQEILVKHGFAAGRRR
jgi:molybdenum ABC transporter molybdate-binding protein